MIKTIRAVNISLRAGLAVAGAALLAAQPILLLPQTAQAAVSSWQKGASITPTSTTDFASASFQQSLQNLKNDGATYVNLIIPYYQSNPGSTDIGAGYNTPSDAALGSAIDYAHSLGLSVSLDMHDDPYTGDWRAYINPGDRATWFANYGNYLTHLAGIAQAHHAELLIVGAELVDMAAYSQNGDNTGEWQKLIGEVRGVYSGKLSYDANSDNNTQGGVFQDEKDYIGFWGSLDYVALSAYYNLNTSNTDVGSLEGQWSYWQSADLGPFESRVNKPILFAEVGYRSIDEAHEQPWNWYQGGNYNASEQANDYQALFDFWNNYGYIAGVYLWNWSSDPNAGGSGNTDYTPQHKSAESVMRQWFINPGNPSGGGSGPAPGQAFNATGSYAPSGASAGSAVSLSAAVQDNNMSLSGGIVDLEVYDSNNNRAFQQFYSASMSPGQSATFTAQWTPSSAGSYHLAIGVFSGDWSHNYYWSGDAANISVAQGSSGGSSGGSSPAGPLDVWWPTDGAHVNGVQPFKAMVENIDPSQYRMYWQVGGGQWNAMSDNAADYPHKEAEVDLSGWNWNSAGPYPVTFVATQTDGSTVIEQKTMNVWTQ